MLNLQGKDRKDVKRGNGDLCFSNKSNCQRESKREKKKKKKEEKKKKEPHNGKGKTTIGRKADAKA